MSVVHCGLHRNMGSRLEQPAIGVVKPRCIHLVLLLFLVFMTSLFHPCRGWAACDAEILDPDTPAVKKALDDFAFVSGLVRAWQAVGYNTSTKGISDFLREVTEIIREPGKKAVELSMGAISDVYNNQEIAKLYEYKKAWETQDRSSLTVHYPNQKAHDPGSIVSFARGAGCPPGKESQWFDAWIDERYKKEKEALEILRKAKKFGIPINLSHLRQAEPGMLYGSSPRKISANPYTFMNKMGQIGWNYDILLYSIEKYKRFEKDFDDRLAKIFEGNGIPRSLLKTCLNENAKDVVLSQYMAKTYELMCQEGERGKLTQEISDVICRQAESCKGMFRDYAGKKLDCGSEKKAEPTQTSQPIKSDSKKEPGKKDSSSLSSKDRDSLFYDLCRCSCNPTVGGGSKYDPSRGCVCSGPLGGEWTVPMVPSGDCFDRAVTAAGVDPRKLSEEIVKNNYELYKKLIEEARRIIEEYIILKPGLFQKKSSLEGPRESNRYVLLAANFTGNASMGEFMRVAAAAGGDPMSYPEMVKEKNRRGDPDRAMGLVRAAEAMMPDRKASGETTNILAEFAIMMSKASLNIVTELEFDDGLYLLRKAAEFYKAGESNALGQNIKRLIDNFEMWKKNWQTLQGEVPTCLAMIRDKRVCECEKLREEKITPAANGLDIREYASSQKWEIGTASGGQPRPIPKKEKLMADLKQKLETAQRQCASIPALKTKDMAQLNDYQTRKTLEKSPYINQEDLKKYSALPISDEQTIKKAEKILGEQGLCDCQNDKIRDILETAKEGFKSSKLEVDLTANKESLRLGEYVRVSLMIKSGRKPYTYSITGDLASTAQGTEAGLVTDYPPKTPGTKTVRAVVTDAAGDSRTAAVMFEVLSSAGASATKDQDAVSKTSSTGSRPVYDPTQDKNISGVPKPIDTDKIGELSTGFQDRTTRRKPKDPPLAVQQPGIDSKPTSDASGSQKQTPQTPQTPQTKQTAQSPQTTQTPYSSSSTQPQDDPGKNIKDSAGNLSPPVDSNQPKDDQTQTITGGATQGTTPVTTSSTKATEGTVGKTTVGKTTASPTSTTSTTSGKVNTGSTITATYINQTKENAHIFTEGETFGSGNRLAPGEKRNVQVKPLPDGRIKFYAGRNGKVIDSKYWSGTGGDQSRYPMVKFVVGMGGKEALSITTNLK